MLKQKKMIFGRFFSYDIFLNKFQKLQIITIYQNQQKRNEVVTKIRQIRAIMKLGTIQTQPLSG